MSSEPTPPVFSQRVRDAILAEIPKYPEPRSALLVALHLVQAELGHVPLAAHPQDVERDDGPAEERHPENERRDRDHHRLHSSGRVA